MSAALAIAGWGAFLAAVAALHAAARSGHNPRSGGCRYFSYSFDTLSERCFRCEK